MPATESTESTRSKFSPLLQNKKIRKGEVQRGALQRPLPKSLRREGQTEGKLEEYRFLHPVVCLIIICDWRLDVCSEIKTPKGICNHNQDSFNTKLVGEAMLNKDGNLQWQIENKKSHLPAIDTYTAHIQDELGVFFFLIDCLCRWTNHGFFVFRLFSLTSSALDHSVTEPFCVTRGIGLQKKLFP